MRASRAQVIVRVGCACESHHPPHSHGPEPALGAEVRELMSKAFKGPLIPTQQQQVLAELEADSRLVYHCGLTPQKVGAGLATTSTHQPPTIPNSPETTPGSS